MRPRGASGAAVDDEILGPLGDLGVEVVQEHPQRRLGLPRAGVQLRAARSANPGEIPDERLDRGIERRDAHRSAPISASAAARIDPSRIAPATRSMSSAERPVLADALRELAHGIVRRAHARRRLERREELDRLRTGEQLDRERQLGIRQHLQRLQPGGVPHRDVILLARARRDRVDARRMAERLVLGDERRRHVLGDHEARVEAALAGEERRQPLRERRVDEPLDPPLGDVRELGDRHRERVEPERERLAVEVAVRDDQPLVDEHERVVGRGVELDRDRRLDVVEQIAARTVHLRRAAQRVGVLHLVAPAMRLDDRRPLEQAEHVRGRVELPAQAAAPAWIAGWKLVCDPCSASSESAHARSAVRASRLARTSASAAIAAMNCVPLISESPSFAASRIGSSPAARERVRAREERPVEPRLPLADERQRQMRERCEIAAGADRAARGHAREHAAVEAFDQELDRLDSRARVALGERVRAEQHRRAHDLVRVRLADAAGVAAEQAKLQLLDLVVRDRLRDEAAEPRVDAVGVLARPARRARAPPPSSPAPRPRAPRAPDGRRPPRRPRSGGRSRSARDSRSPSESSSDRVRSCRRLSGDDVHWLAGRQAGNIAHVVRVTHRDLCSVREPIRFRQLEIPRMSAPQSSSLSTVPSVAAFGIAPTTSRPCKSDPAREAEGCRRPTTSVRALSISAPCGSTATMLGRAGGVASSRDTTATAPPIAARRMTIVSTRFIYSTVVQPQHVRMRTPPRLSCGELRTS